MPYKESNWTYHVAIDGVNYGYWAEKEGGGVDSDEGSYDDWDGTVVLGGKRTRENITLRKGYRKEVHAVFRTLDAAAGAGQAVVTGSPTDDDGKSWGDPITYRGVLKAVSPPDMNKGSSDAGKLVIVITPNVRLA